MHDIADAHIVERHIDRFAITDHTCRFCLQTHQTADCGRGAAFGTCLQITTNQDQRDNDCRCLEVNIHCAFGQNIRPEGCNDGEAPCGCRSDDHQRIHVWCAAQQCRNAFLEKAHTGAKQHHCGEHELEIPAVLHSDRVHDEHVHSRNDMRSHFKNENRQRQNCGKDNALLQFCSFCIALVRLRFLRRIAARFIKRTGFVTCSLDCLDKVTERHLTRKLYMCTLCRKIDTGARYARNGVQCLFDLADAGRAGHAFNSEISATGWHVIASLANGIDDRRHIGSCFKGHVSAFSCKIDQHLVNARHLRHGFFNGRNTGSATHALNGNGKTCGFRFDWLVHGNPFQPLF